MGKPVKSEPPFKLIEGFIPEEIDWRFFEQNYPLPKNVTINGLNYILIYMSSYTEWKKGTKKVEVYNKEIPINSTELRKVLSNYTDYINYLVTAEIIYLAMNKAVGHSSRRYAFPQWYSGIVVPITINDEKICRAEQKRKKKALEIPQNRYPFLTRWFNNNLHFDVAAYNQYLESDEGWALTGKETIQARASHQIACMKIANKDFYYTCDKASGRFHSNLTNLKKRYRNFLSYKGQQLSAVDLCNSQPYFLAFFIKHLSERTDNILLNKILEYTGAATRARILKVIKEMEVYNNLVNDVHNFSQLVSEGEVYDFFGKLLLQNNFLSIDPIQIDRDFSKEALIHFLFSKPKSNLKKIVAIRPIFQQQWPSLYKLISTIKEGENSTPDLPNLLSSAERHFFLSIIAKNYSTLEPNSIREPNSNLETDSCLFSIHDSLICPTSNVEHLHDYMQTSLFELTGIKPTLKIEHWK